MEIGQLTHIRSHANKQGPWTDKLMVSPARFVYTSARCTEDGGLLVVHGLASQAPILFDSLECLLHLADVELLDDVGLAILLEISHVSLVHIRGRAAMLLVPVQVDLLTLLRRMLLDDALRPLAAHDLDEAILDRVLPFGPVLSHAAQAPDNAH